MACLNLVEGPQYLKKGTCRRVVGWNSANRSYHVRFAAWYPLRYTGAIRQPTTQSP